MAEVIALFMTFLFSVVFARYLGVQNYGVYTFAVAFVALFKVFTDLGLNTLLIREISRYKERTDYFFSNALVIEIFLSWIFVPLTAALAYYLGNEKETVIIILLFAIMQSIETIGWINLSTFNAYEHREYEGLVKIIGKFTAVTAGLIGIFLQLRLVEIAALFVVGSALQLVFNYIVLVKKVVRPRVSINVSTWPGLLKISLPFALTALFFDLYFNVNTIILSYISGDEAVGWYSVAFRVVNLFAIIPTALTGSIWPFFSRMHLTSKERLNKAFSKSVEYLMMLAIPISIGMILIANILLPLIFGEEYTNSVPVMQIISVSLTFLFINYISMFTLGAINKPHLGAISLFTGLIVNISIGIILIPTYGYIGAAVAIAVSEVALFFQYLLHLSKNGINVSIPQFAIKPLIAAGAMAGVIFSIKGALVAFPDILKLMVIIPTAIGVYFLGLILLKTFKEEDSLIFSEITEYVQSLISRKERA